MARGRTNPSAGKLKQAVEKVQEKTEDIIDDMTSTLD